uniref:Casein kinase I-like n=1 Tax=Dermatophagoides pteronyssinus TaxID=6956 RepID=A0A6P6Y8A4_DERPT|nr:casein kinase I-like [Dermatophagoides pteronyssinus]
MEKSKSTNTSSEKLPKYPIATGQILDGRFLIERHFNTEIFSNYYLGTYHDSDRTRWIFIKMKHNQDSNDIDMIRWEYKVYKSLETSAGMLRVPQPLYFGSILTYEAIVLELLGPSLLDMWNKCDQRLSIRALAQIGYQLICLMKYFHDRGFVYRNIRPEHFLYGVTGSEKWMWMYAIDLKWCKTYSNEQQSHIKMEQANGPLQIGTHIRYMSINAHRGVEQSRRDDLESIGYLLTYLFCRKLPWMELENIVDRNECHRRIAECKEKSLSTICQRMLHEFEQYLMTVRKLSFDEKPNYQNLGELFLNVQRSIGFESKFDLYDWNIFHRPKN